MWGRPCLWFVENEWNNNIDKIRMEMGKVARRLCLGLLFGGMSCVGNEAGAVVKLPSLVGDRMVLQRETDLKIWGWADPGEKVTVRFRGAHYYTEADAKGGGT